MIREYGYARRYRLRRKARFAGWMAALALLTAGALYIALGPGARAGLAMSPSSAANAIGSVSPDRAAAPQAGVMDATPLRHSGMAGSPGKENGGDWRLVLVNKAHPLPDGFHVETRQLPSGLPIDARAYDDLMDMIHDGEAQGLDFVICSAYRSIEKQEDLFSQQVSVEQSNGLDYQKAVEEAGTKVAVPGTSEHNLGLAVDIVAMDHQLLDRAYTDTPEFQWLSDNSCRYGFIMRYPEDKSAITGIIFEPWHFRYVGAGAAAEIEDAGVCLEEYLDEAGT